MFGRPLCGPIGAARPPPLLLASPISPFLAASALLALAIIKLIYGNQVVEASSSTNLSLLWI